MYFIQHATIEKNMVTNMTNNGGWLFVCCSKGSEFSNEDQTSNMNTGKFCDVLD